MSLLLKNLKIDTFLVVIFIFFISTDDRKSLHLLGIKNVFRKYNTNITQSK